MNDTNSSSALIIIPLFLHNFLFLINSYKTFSFRLNWIGKSPTVYEIPLSAEAQRYVSCTPKSTLPTIMADKPQEAEDQHLQPICLESFLLHLIYPPRYCMRKANPAKLWTVMHGQKAGQLIRFFFL